MLFRRPADLDFVLSNVQGVLDGTPVWKNFQSRILGPWGVAALDAVTGDRVVSLRSFLAATTLAANVLLFELLRRRGENVFRALCAVGALALARVVLAYRLEYPWDGLNVLLFVAFGHWAARGRPLRSFAPWLLAGTLNHEAALYIPVWYVIAAFRKDGAELSGKRSALVASAALAAMGAVIIALRERFYSGPPSLPGVVIEPGTPIIGNPVQLLHNLECLVALHWRADAFVTVAFIATSVLLVVLLALRVHRASVLWTLCVLATILCFGYVNETRLYLPLAAFWISHLASWPRQAVHVAT